MEENTPTPNTPQPNFEPPIPTPGQQFAPAPPPDEAGHKKTKKKPLLIGLLVVLLLSIGAAAAYYFLVYNKTEAPATETSESQTEVAETGPNALIYNSQLDQTKPANLASLNFSDNDVTNATINYDSIRSGTVNGQKIAIIGNKEAKEAVLYSDDAGKNYKEIWQNTDNGGQITDIVFSNDASSVLVAVLPKDQSTNQLIEVVLDETNTAKDIASLDSAGILLYDYNKTAQQVIYIKTCWNCDGGASAEAIYTYDAKTKASTELYKTTSPSVIATASLRVKADSSEVSFVESAISTNTNEIGATLVGPYVIKSVKLESKEAKTIETLGEAGAALTTDLGYSTDNKLFYSDGKKLTLVDGDQKSVLFETTKNLNHVFYVDDKRVIAGVTETGKSAVINFGLENKTSADIISFSSGSSEILTNIIGVTQK